MKNVIASAGLIVLGAASLQAANDSGLSEVEKAKPWSLSATLRGFYDDNYNTRPDAMLLGKSVRRDSFGFQLSPTAKLNLALDQTLIGLSYTYDMRYYDDRINNSADHSHYFNGSINHKFSDVTKLDVSDTFVIAQEPGVLDPSGSGLPFRANGNNIRNTANIALTAGLTDTMSTVVGYNNNYIDYDQKGAGNYAALLNRTEHLGSIALRYKVADSTTASLGYQYGITDYNSKEGLYPAPAAYVSPAIRNSTSHYGYVGVDQYMNPNLLLSAKAGIQHIIHDDSALKALTGKSSSDTSPYAEAAVTWNYTPGSSLLVGVRHQHQASDITGLSASPNLDAESTTLYTTLSHKMGDWTGTLTAHYINSEYTGGGAGIKGKADNIYGVGLNISYQVNQYLAAEIGYNYDKLSSDLDVGPTTAFSRGYDRNRVYLGVRASY